MSKCNVNANTGRQMNERANASNTGRSILCLHWAVQNMGVYEEVTSGEVLLGEF
jgi:hypothetical protein